MPDSNTDFLLEKLIASGCSYPKVFNSAHWAALSPFYTFAAIVSGTFVDGKIFCSTVWFYHSLKAAALALSEWDGDGAPKHFLYYETIPNIMVWP